MTTFRVGDRVRVINSPEVDGVIVSFFGPLVEVLRDEQPRRPSSQRGWAHYPHELEPAPEPDACKACGEHVSAPHSPQCPEDALNRIAEEWESQRQDDTTALRRIAAILRETGRL